MCRNSLVRCLQGLVPQLLAELEAAFPARTVYTPVDHGIRGALDWPSADALLDAGKRVVIASAADYGEVRGTKARSLEQRCLRCRAPRGMSHERMKRDQRLSSAPRVGRTAGATRLLAHAASCVEHTALPHPDSIQGLCTLALDAVSTARSTPEAALAGDAAAGLCAGGRLRLDGAALCALQGPAALRRRPGHAARGRRDRARPPAPRADVRAALRAVQLQLRVAR